MIGLYSDAFYQYFGFICLVKFGFLLCTCQINLVNSLLDIDRSHLPHNVFHNYISFLTNRFLFLQEVEKDVKDRTRGEMGAAKSLCSPFDQPELPEGTSTPSYFMSWSLLSPLLLPVTKFQSRMPCQFFSILLFGTLETYDSGKDLSSNQT